MARFFWVEVVDERSRTFEVSKQGGDSLAFAVGRPPGFHRFALGENAFGEMFGCIENWGLGVGC